GGLGDFILALPVLEALHKRFEGLHLEVMCASSMIPLVMGTGHICGAKSAETPGLSTFYGDGACPDPRFSEYFRTFNRIILLGVDPEGRFSANVRLAGAGEVAVIPPFPPRGLIVHVSDYLVRSTTGFLRADPPRVEIFNEEFRSAREFILAGMGRSVSMARGGFPSLAAIHPGSGGAGKIWPPAYMARVVHGLIQEGHINGILLIQGPADDEYAKVLHGELDGILVIPVSNRPLLELSAILRSARLFLGSDSGVAHLAAAVGVPTGVIFGPTDPRLWAPRGPCVAVIRKEMPCAPCGYEGMRICMQRDCLGEVLVEDVLNTARSLLQKQSNSFCQGKPIAWRFSDDATG
ncbi:MAG: glycosyltransferase family 9 protein, partial [Deltaproteobacteria bacterium]|nr:glycosyltransferase family 9 protein [Deltaproteobacteria bacterium]